MNELFQWNRKQGELYRKDLTAKFQERIRPQDFSTASQTDPQKFYLEFKERVGPLVQQHIEQHKKELNQQVHCHLVLLKQTVLADVTIRFSLSTAVWLYNKIHDDSLTENNVPLAIAGTGGYAREETYFCSDTDIQILFRPPVHDGNDSTQKILEYFQYLFTYQDFFRTSGSFGLTKVDDEMQLFDPVNVKQFYDLTENRYVAGDKAVYNEFKNEVDELGQLYQDTITQYCFSHRSYYDVSNTVFKQEPDIKEEMRRLYWALSLCRLRRSVTTINQFELLYELYTLEALSGPAYKNIQASLDFLARLRLFLHCYQKGSLRDALSYEVREKVAESLGFPILEFYKEYFYNAVYPLKRYSRNLFWESVFCDIRGVKNLSEDFAVNAENQIVCRTDPEKLLAEKPELMFKIFTWVADRGCYLSYPIICAIEQNVDQVSPIFVSEEVREEVRQYFKTIIRGKFFARAFRLLHEFGLLSNYYIPEFQNLCGLLQDIYVHQFPTDVHILAALDNLNGLELDRDSNPFLSELYQSVRDKTGMKLAVLLHDIGKGHKKDGENEELVGAQLIPGILNRLGYFEERRIKDVAYLVKIHLMMRDLMLLDPEDDETYDLIWDLVDYDKERLKMLILLTYADRGGTKMKLSSSEIEQLKFFYQQTVYHKKRSSVPQFVKAEFIRMVRLPRDQQMQLEVFNEFIKSNDQFAVDLIFKPEEASQLVVCARDESGLLFKMASVLAFNGLDVIGADIHTHEGKVFDVFTLMGSGGKPIDYSDYFFIQKKVKQEMKRIVAEGEPISQVYRDKPLSTQINSEKFENVRVKLNLIGRAVKLESQDFFGTFMMQAKVFSDLGMQIEKAVLHSHQDIASNVYYLRAKDVEWIMNNENRFRTHITDMLGQLLRSESILLETEMEAGEKPPAHLPQSTDTDNQPAPARVTAPLPEN